MRDQESPTDGPPLSETLSDGRKHALALIAACALFMEALDSTAIAPALPTIAREFGAAPLDLSLALSGYLVTLAVMIPASGWMADRFGARRVFAGALCVFTLGSVLCSVSGSLTELVGARVVQGLGGAMMSPVARLVVLHASRKSEFVRLMSWVTIPGLVGPVLGPGVGGFLTEFAGWRWIFLVNVPIGVVGVALALRLIPDLPHRPAGRLDVLGLALAGTATGGLVFGMDLISTGHVSGAVGVGLLAAALLSGAAYALRARRQPDPLLDLGLLRHRTFMVAFVGGLPFRIGVGALPLLLPLLFQLGFGLDAFRSGLLVVAATAGALVMKALAPWMIEHVSYRRLLVWNGLANAVLYAGHALFPVLPWAGILALLLAGGLVRSLQFTALNTLAYADVPPLRLSRATSLASVGMQVGLSLGIGVGSGLVAVATAWTGGGTAGSAEIAPAFPVLGALALVHVAVSLLLPPDAGDEMRGRRRLPEPRVDAPEPQPGRSSSR
jgi:EmrB/QacA subfamily drug resistance transporter